MNIRFEQRKPFFVSGYSMETSEETLEKDCATLREKYEDKLRTISNHLYFIAWMGEEETMIYHFGVEVPDLNPVTSGATCVEIPASRFIVGTVPEGASVLATWYEFFEKGIPSSGAEIDIEFPYHFESFDEKGSCTLWTPVKE